MSSTPPTSAPAASTTRVADAGSPIARIEQSLRHAIVTVLGEAFADADPQVRPSQRPEHGDFQANAAMGLAKRAKTNPRELALRLVEATRLDDLAESLEVAGPGFINIRLSGEALSRMLAKMAGPDLGVTPAAEPATIAIDLCGVNVAKQMHVGHLRSTIIGDALARVGERLGRTVHRENHLGDWGLPIAMVLHQLRADGIDLDALTLADLDAAYRDAQLTCRADERGLAAAEAGRAGPHRIIELTEQNAGAAEALEGAKTTLVRLQQGDEEIERDWNRLIDCTLGALEEALELLNVKIGREDHRGESFYRERLPGVVDAMVRAGVAHEDQGALVVRFEDRPRPLLVRKSDGGFLYATTDLAAVRYRAQELNADRVIYVVDARQRDHFRDVFDAARLMDWDRHADGRRAQLVHVPFGAVLGPDKKPLKTRSGENVTLKALLDEAVERGTREVMHRAESADAPTHGMDARDLAAIGRAVGIGAVKYADLSNDLVRDYVFDFDRMLAFEGNTGPYVQYAHARICSIFSRAGVDPASVADAPFRLEEPTERQLALLLLRYHGVLEDVDRSLEPHRLCTYLYDLADAFSSFYQECPVLKASDPALMASRLRLSDLVRRVLADGLGLLGIETPRSM